MKQFKSQKWVLSAFLVAALGSQYYFSVSSKEISSIEMSSTALTADQTQTIRDATAIVSRLGSVSGTPIVSATSVATAPAASGTPAVHTEGSAASAPCADCAVLTPAEVVILQRALQIQISTSGTATVVNAPAPVVDECAEGTEAEKIRCRREAVAQAARDAVELKKEKESEKLDARNEEFITKMEKAVDKCRGEIGCLTSSYTNLLGRYTGRKAISPQVAQNAFRQYIEPQLKAKLSSMDDTSNDANNILSTLANSVPSEYRQIKDMAVLDVRQAAVARATSIKTTLTEAKAAADNKDLEQSRELIAQANAERAELRADIYGDPQSGREGVLNVLAGTRDSDSVTWAYTQSQLSSPVRALFTDMNTHYNHLFNAGLSADQTPQSTQGTTTTRGSTRGGDTTNNGVGPQLPGSQSSGTDGKLSQPVTGSNSVNFGQVTNTSTGTRGPRN